MAEVTCISVAVRMIFYIVLQVFSLVQVADELICILLANRITRPLKQVGGRAAVIASVRGFCGAGQGEYRARLVASCTSDFGARCCGR